MTNLKRIFLAFLLLPLLTSCVETVVLGSAATGYLATREKSFSNTQKDVTIASKLGTQFFEKGLKNPGNSIDITVNEGRVLLTGIVRDATKARLANDLAWRLDGVKEVIDEVQVRSGDTLRIRDFANATADYLITSEIESKLLFKRYVASVNFKITTVNKTVYIIGVAQNDDEMKRVLSTASRVRGVNKVVNHIIFVDDKRRNG